MTMNEGNEALLVGQALRSAFTDDEKFRAIIRRTNSQLVAASKNSPNNLVKFGLESSFNKYIVSSYYAARSIELLKLEIDKFFRREKRTSNFLFLVYHSFALEAVFGLASARSIFTLHPVCECLADQAPAIVKIFDNVFPNLVSARDALAHDDERVLGMVRKKPLGTEFEHAQFTSLRGTQLGCKNEHLEDIEFCFPSEKYIELLELISASMK